MSHRAVSIALHTHPPLSPPLRESGRDWLRGVVEKPESDAFPCDVFHGQVVGVFPWDGAFHKLHKSTGYP